MINTIIHGNCLDKLKDIPDNSVDSIVTDPPYELGFMGKSWDKTGIANNVDMWKECLRVLKPGGHLLSFGGTRTYHRMACAIEDAGFEVRDMISWIYGSGFPKSLNIGKAVDKLGGRCLGQEIGNIIKTKRIELGYSTIKLAEIGGFYGNTNHGGTVSNWETGRGSITPEQFNKLIEILGLENEPVIATERELLGKQTVPINLYQNIGGDSITGEVNITKGSSEWEGWGTALKPACEPCVLARKPLSEKTVAENVLKWGTGGINIDGSRVGTSGARNNGSSMKSDIYGEYSPTEKIDYGMGRFPANLIHDGSDEVLGLFPSVKGSKASGLTATKARATFNNSIAGINRTGYEDNGSAARFFYCAKTSKSERNKGCEELPDTLKLTQMRGANGTGEKNFEGGFQDVVMKNNHPTVKPQALMKYLIKLITPPGGIVLDPFAGSGSTLVAAKDLGHNYIGIEMTEEYIPIIQARLK